MTVKKKVLVLLVITGVGVYVLWACLIAGGVPKKMNEANERQTREASEETIKLPPNIENYYSYIPAKNVDVVTAFESDYDGDGDMDIAVITIDKPENRYQENFIILYIWENDGYGNFRLKQRAEQESP